jgi:hypothetical protein
MTRRYTLRAGARGDEGGAAGGKARIPWGSKGKGAPQSDKDTAKCYRMAAAKKHVGAKKTLAAALQ